MSRHSGWWISQFISWRRTMNFVKKLFGRSKKPAQPARAFVESLESRVLLTADGPQVTSAVSDNRGLTTIFFNQPLDPTTVNTNSVVVFTPGPDGTLNTHDDVQVSATVIYGAPQQR